VCKVMNESRAGRGGWIITINASIARSASRDPCLHRLMDGATIRVADGAPIAWANAVAGTPVPERVTGSSLVFSLTEAAASHGISVGFVGGLPGDAERAASRLRSLYGDLHVAGAHEVPLDFDSRGPAGLEVAANVAQLNPGIVFCGLGFPKQELLIERMRLQMPHTWFVGVGIAIAYASGRQRRSPQLLRSLGMEWAHRMSREPRRLAPRYAADAAFLPSLFARALNVRLSRHS
jgi:N-acetylglucosaminyldiphosphoundecaprenol N-acetyl-beta-D-mannosaminyltransferase